MIACLAHFSLSLPRWLPFEKLSMLYLTAKVPWHALKVVWHASRPWCPPTSHK
jgi:hypothetical protein